MIRTASTAPRRSNTRRSSSASGPAGLTLAMELARRGRPTLVLESGSIGRAPRRSFPPRRSSTRNATTTCGSRSPDASGTSNLWGGRSLPLDPVDFVPRAPSPALPAGRSATPISRRTTRPPAATPIAASQRSNSPRPNSPSPIPISRSTAIERASNRPWFQRAHAATLAGSPLIDIRLGANVVGLELTENGRVVGVVAATANGDVGSRRTGRSRRRRTGVDPTLLATQRLRPTLYGGPDGPLGRYYMGHVIGEIADVVFDERGSTQHSTFCTTAAAHSSAAVSPRARR